MGFKAALFDMDGTLLDTLSDLGLSANRMLAQKKFPVHPLEEYRYFVGSGTLNLVTRILPENARDEGTLKDCLKVFLDIYESSWKANTKPYPGVSEMLDSLRAKGYRLAILSNKPQDFTSMCTNEFLSDWAFEEIWGKRESFELKPSPKSALKIAELMKLDPAEFIYMGDTGIDMETACNAGMYPVGVTWGFRPKEELLEAGAKTLLNNPSDVDAHF